MCVYVKGLAMTSSDQEIREHVRDRYAAAALSVVSGSAASCCGPSDGPQTSCCGPSDALSAISDTEEGDIFGAALYTPGETDGLPEEAVLASLGCGNPLAVAELREGRTGAGPGIRRRDRRAAVRPSGRPDRVRLRPGHDRRDAGPGQGQRGQGRRDERGIREGSDRGHPAARFLDRCGDLQLRDQPVHRQARGHRARCSGC